MLDTKAGWDELIRRHAPDAKVRDAVLANPLYQNITSRFVHSHDYLAMEQLHDLHATGEYDLVVVDTPPSRNALSVLDAPARMREFFGSRLLRWLTVPYRSRLFTVASKPFYQIADRVLGSGFLRDIADFFVLFQAMEKGFVARAREVEALLGDARTTFLVVSTLETAPAHEAVYLARELLRARLRPRRDRRQPGAAGGADATRRGDQRQAARRGGDRPARSSATSPRRSTAPGPAVDERVVRDVLTEVAAPLPRRRPRRHPRGRATRRAGGAGATGARRAVARLRRQRPRRPDDARRSPARLRRRHLGAVGQIRADRADSLPDGLPRRSRP